jgi:hypothetical protein
LKSKHLKNETPCLALMLFYREYMFCSRHFRTLMQLSIAGIQNNSNQYKF